MSEEEPGKDQAVPETESGEEHVTPPQPQAPAAQWSMPEPVFQQTSGYLPQGYLKQLEDAAAAAKGGDVLDIPAIPIAAPDDAAETAEASAEPVLEMENAAVVPAVPTVPEAPEEPEVGTAVPEVPDVPSVSEIPEDSMASAGHAVAEVPAMAEVPFVPTPPAVDIVPQPELSAEFSNHGLIAEPAAPTVSKSSGLRTVLLVLAFLGMLLILGVFLVFVYLYFIAGSVSGNNF